MAQDFQRSKEGFRFRFAGMKLNSPADAIGPTKYAVARNIRATQDDTIATRPGLAQLFMTGAFNLFTTDGRAYSAMNTDNLPRILVRTADDAIFLDDGTQVGTLAGSGVPRGAAFIPFRPNASPNPYMYVANGSDYQKFSAPAPGVIAQKVGIAEPQHSPEAYPGPQMFTELVAPGGQWSTAGTASAWVPGDRSTDLVVAALPDPDDLTFHRWSVQVGIGTQYQVGELVNFTGTPPQQVLIEDVIAPLSISMTVQGIYYFAGSTGRCVVVPQGISVPFGNVREQGSQSGVAVPTAELIARLRRGALIQIGTEVCYVHSVSTGPNQQISIETVTTLTHAIGEQLVGLPTIVINGITNPTSLTAATTIIGDQGNTESFQVTVGIGTLTMGATGGSGVIIGHPTTFLNGWGPNAHVGSYEGGVNQGYSFGLDPNSTAAYANPGLAFDGNPNTAATIVFQHTHQYAGCVWRFAAVAPTGRARALNILSEVPANGSGGLTITLRSAGVWYSLNGGTTWQQVYNQGPRLKQWDTISLPVNQNLALVQVMAFTDAHDDMAHSVYEINITEAPNNPVIGASTGAYQEDDYVHFSVKLDNPNLLNEMKLLFDVGDGSFTQNYYYYAVRPSDIVPASSNTVTQLAAAQAILQQDEISAAARAAGLAISAPSVAGASQWSEIMFPIAALTRVGGDQTKTLANIIGVQFLVNASATVQVAVSSLAFIGGGQPDTGDVGSPYKYRVRPRSSVTGAVGNPSPENRYGTVARRQKINVSLPSAAYDAQIDTWDIFRYGGAVTQFRYIGSVPSTSSTFEDNYSDPAAQAGPSLDFDNYEPWPSVDVPNNGTATSVTGTSAIVVSASANILSYLPGTLVQLGGQNVYTLRTRPTSLGGTNYLLDFIENAGAALAIPFAIQEPDIANRHLAYMWGPDAAGTVFAVGDSLRPGTLYFAKNNAPDSAPSSYNLEITPPTEPLLGGEILDGLSFVGSTERWWALYPQPANPAQRYSVVQLPLTRGLAAPYGHCSDGQVLFWWAKDGIYASDRGSLTHADLYNLFPHDGVAGVDVTYAGRTVHAPDYSKAASFRLTYSNSYLYATYISSDGVYRTLVLDLRRMAWSEDIYATQISWIYHVEQQVESASVLNPVLLMGGRAPGPGVLQGAIFKQQALTNDGPFTITCALATVEFDGGDLRTGEQWGDIYLDSRPAARGNGLKLTPMFLGANAAAQQPIAQSLARTQLPVSVGGAVTTNFLGVLLEWTDDFTLQTIPTELFVWQPSWLIQPEQVIDRFTDWDDAGAAAAKWVQGFVLEADTANVVKGIQIRDSDLRALHTFTPPVLHNDQSQHAYSFDVPFVAHMMRIEPTDALLWRMWGVRWIFEPTPEQAETWQTQGTSFGLTGYMHIKQISVAYASTVDINLAITSFDGQSPAAITLPATGGAFQKTTFQLTPNKGQLYFFRATPAAAAAPFQFFLPDWEVMVGQWGRETPYLRYVNLGGEKGDKATI